MLFKKKYICIYIYGLQRMMPAVFVGPLTLSFSATSR